MDGQRGRSLRFTNGHDGEGWRTWLCTQQALGKREGRERETTEGAKSLNKEWSKIREMRKNHENKREKLNCGLSSIAHRVLLGALGTGPQKKGHLSA